MIGWFLVDAYQVTVLVMICCVFWTAYLYLREYSSVRRLKRKKLVWPFPVKPALLDLMACRKRWLSRVVYVLVVLIFLRVMLLSYLSLIPRGALFKL